MLARLGASLLASPTRSTASAIVTASIGATENLHAATVSPPLALRTTMRLFVEPEDALSVDLAVGEQAPEIARGEERDLLPASLLLPAEREALVQRALKPYGQELEERELVVRLDRELTVGRLDVVAISDAPDLVRELRLERLGDVLDHGARERERELIVRERHRGRVADLHRDVGRADPLAVERIEVERDDLVRRVEPLQRRA